MRMLGASLWVIEELRFSTNGNDQVVKLMTRDTVAVFHGGPNPTTTLACDEVWSADLPHVIYGQIVVDPGCTLTLEPICSGAAAMIFRNLGEGRGPCLLKDNWK